MFCTRGSLRMCWNAGMPRCPLGGRVNQYLCRSGKGVSDRESAELKSVLITDLPARMLRRSWRMGERQELETKKERRRLLTARCSHAYHVWS